MLPEETLSKPWKDLTAEEFKAVGEFLGMRVHGEPVIWLQSTLKNIDIKVTVFRQQALPIYLSIPYIDEDGDTDEADETYKLQYHAKTSDIIAAVERIRDAFGGWA